MRTLFRLLLVSALATLAAWGTIASAQTPKDALIIADAIDSITTLDPHQSSQIVNRQAYETLVGFDPADPETIYGVIAESWTVSDDSKTFTFRIRPGISFASGRQLNAKDVAYSLQRSVSVPSPISFILTQFGLSEANAATAITASGDEVTIVLPEAYSPSFFLFCLSTSAGAILDAELVESHAKDKDWGAAWLKLGAAAGSGPFAFSEWQPNSRITLTRNDGYWGTRPAISSMVFLHVPEGATQRLMLEKGDIDVATKLTPDDFDALGTSGAVDRVSTLSGTIYYMAVNAARKPFDSPAAVEALKYLVDYEGMATTILNGGVKVHQTFLPEGYLGAIESNPYSLDVAKAKALLAEAGVPEGQTIDMVVWNTYPYAEMSQAIQASFAAAGLNVNIELVDGGQWIDRYLSADLNIWLGLWGPDYPDPHSNAKAFAVNKEFSPDAYVSLADRYGFHSEAFSKRAMDAVRESDAKVRAEMYGKLQIDHQSVAPFVFMFQEARSVGVRKGLSGLALGTTFADDRYWAVAKP